MRMCTAVKQSSAHQKWLCTGLPWGKMRACQAGCLQRQGGRHAGLLNPRPFPLAEACMTETLLCRELHFHSNQLRGRLAVIPGASSCRNLWMRRVEMLCFRPWTKSVSGWQVLVPALSKHKKLSVWSNISLGLVAVSWTLDAACLVASLFSCNLAYQTCTARAED